MRSALTIGALVLLAAAVPAEAKWVWSSDTGFVDTDTYETGDPEVLYKKAQELYDAGAFDDAAAEFTRIALYVSDGRYREQALFMSGEAFYKAGKFYRAYLAYDEYLNLYSRSERVKYVIQQLADCGFKLMGGAKKEFLGLPILPGTGTGTEIVKHVIEKYPYEEGSDQFHYLLINHYLDELDYEQATLEADLFLTTYPNSQWGPTVQFQKGSAQLAAHQGVAYDPTPLQDARKSFQDYLERNPNGDRTQEAKDRLSEIDEKQAQKDFDVADFYRRTGHPDSARVYFEMVIRRYPNSSWSQRAQAELEALK